MTERLTKKDWLDHGLKVLATSGAGALKAERLARSLKVSRGSFYWHFRDTADFHAELFECWRTRTTDWVTSDLERKVSGPQRLQHLMRLAFSAEDRLERAVRSWAAQSREAAGAVAAVDQARVAYLTTLLQSAGVLPAAAPGRAAFLYWAHLGRLMIAGGTTKTLDGEDIDAIANLLNS